MPYHDAALLLLGHGSTLNADSSAPTYQHAEEIQRRGIFAEVHVGFWKEEPNFRQALRQTRQRRVFVVPNFISSGYFTEQVIPRELGLTGPIAKVGDQEIYYCQPVGLHSSMLDALMKRADEVVAASGEAPDLKKACLFICGHGTSFNDNSTKIIYEQAELIRKKQIYGDCQPVLMEQRPFVKDWRTLTDCPDVIVVPFFISDGLHSFEDIPVLLGLTHNVKEQTFRNPHRENGRRLWYATAIGTESAMADVILAQVREFEVEHQLAVLDIEGAPASTAFEEFLRVFPQPLTLGQLRIRKENGRTFVLTHVEDDGIDWTTLKRLSSSEEIRELIRLDANGEFRPLRAAPNLRRGWYMEGLDMNGLVGALELFYPAQAANWSLWNANPMSMGITPWQETAERQTGRFRVVREIDDAGIKELVAKVCERECLKRRLWAPAAQSVEAGPNEISLLCPEACNYLVGKAREMLKGPGEE